jgi:single-strand DNA-binding protein
MALNLNTVLIAGHLTRDPAVKRLANDRTVADFGLAINRRYKGSEGELKEDTTFVDIEAWGRTAELIGQYLNKGSPCFVEGRLKYETWQDKDGTRKSRMKVVAENVQFLRNKPKSGDEEPEAESASPSANRVRDTEVGYSVLPESIRLGEPAPF